MLNADLYSLMSTVRVKKAVNMDISRMRYEGMILSARVTITCAPVWGRLVTGRLAAPGRGNTASTTVGWHETSALAKIDSGDLS